MSFDYFYGQQSDLFTFYRVPKVLFTNERFWNISADAKMLYGILLDRMSLSAKNGWIDKNGRVYIIFTIDEAKMALNCAEQKAIKLLSELEKKAGLIERNRQGLGKPNLIYVKNFISAVDSQLLNCENHNSSYSRKSRKRRRRRKRQSLIRMQIMWTMTRTMDTIRSLRTMMQIAPSMKMMMNLCKQDRLDAWGSLRVAFT